MNKSVILTQELIDCLDFTQQQIVQHQLSILSPLAEKVLAIYLSNTPEVTLWLGIDYDYLTQSKKVRDQSSFVFKNPQVVSQLKEYIEKAKPLPKIELHDILYDLLEDEDWNCVQDKNRQLEEYELDQRDFITLGQVRHPISIIKQSLNSTIKVIDQQTFIEIKKSNNDFNINFNEQLTAILITLWMIKGSIREDNVRIIYYPMMSNFGFKVGDKPIYLNRDAMINHNSINHKYDQRGYQSEILDDGGEFECLFYYQKGADYIGKGTHVIDFNKKQQQQIYNTETPEYDISQLNTLHDEQIQRLIQDQNKETSLYQEEFIYEEVKPEQIEDFKCSFVVQEKPFDHFIHLHCPPNHRITGQSCEQCKYACEWFTHQREFYCLDCKEIVNGAFVIQDTNFRKFYNDAQKTLIRAYKNTFPLLLSVPMKIRKKEIDKDCVVELSIQGVSLLHVNYRGITMNLNRGLELELLDHRPTNYDFMDPIDEDYHQA